MENKKELKCARCKQLLVDLKITYIHGSVHCVDCFDTLSYREKIKRNREAREEKKIMAY